MHTVCLPHANLSKRILGGKRRKREGEREGEKGKSRKKEKEGGETVSRIPSCK
jgi:hypothetical protein